VPGLGHRARHRGVRKNLRRTTAIQNLEAIQLMVA
jgi:hypothetical protein